MAQILTTKEIADELGTDPKTLRKFLRSASSPVERVGQGNRYAISRGQLKTLKKMFNAWKDTHTRQEVTAA